MLLTGADYLLEDRYERIAARMNPLSTGIVIICVIVYLARVVRQGYQHG